jgi:hypothetical protein
MLIERESESEWERETGSIYKASTQLTTLEVSIKRRAKSSEKN